MKRTLLYLALFLLLLLVLPVLWWRTQPVKEPVLREPPLVTQPVETAVPPTITPTATAVPFTATPTATTTSVATATDVASNDPAPENQTPVVITNGLTNVRLGPGLAYPVSHVLSSGTAAPILGRNPDSTWWACPDPAMARARTVG